MSGVLRRVLLAFALASAAGSAGAQYPVKPIRLVVPLLAGGPLDNTARIVGQSLSQSLGQPVVIENRPGADGAIAAQAVLAAPADGYTLFFANNTSVVGAPLLNKNLAYDTVTDFTPVSFVGRITLAIYAHPESPATSIADLVAYARANPNKLNYATSTIGDVIAAAQLLNSAGIAMVRVPYKGAAQAMPDLVAGRVQLGIAPISAGLGQVKDGRLRMLAIILPRRSPVVPDVPTIAEAGLPGVTVTTWAGVFGPKNLPREIVNRLSIELNQVVQRPEVRAQFDRQGFQGEGSTPEGLTAILKQELGVWAKIIKDNGITQN
ncbi:MAG: tripartite tricarboxylate transporter substrate binding protein [Betaproteobacteria bacterium]|nr:tripartite tricarboxylate transporter substrate binding protein [Betaproteobacteria bacterium]